MRKVISLGMGIDPKWYRPVEQAAAPLCSVPKAVVVGTRFLADLLWCVLLNQRCGLQWFAVPGLHQCVLRSISSCSHFPITHQDGAGHSTPLQLFPPNTSGAHRRSLVTSAFSSYMFKKLFIII